MKWFYQLLVEHRDVLVALSALLTISIALGGYLSRSIRKLLARIADFFFWFIPGVRHASNLKKYVQKDPHEFPLWGYRRRGFPKRSHWPVLITVMNFKGGVGKTTLTANLAAALSEHRGLKTWVIDLDYQGSLSYMTRGVDLSDDETGSESNQMGDILSCERKSGFKDIRPSAFFDGFANARIVTASQDLAEIEENQLQKWLLHMEKPDGDVRSRLATWLNAVKSVEDMPDIILLDAPPRLSLSAVNALAISDFLLVPTLPQPASIEPIQKLFKRLDKLRCLFKSKVMVLGVVFNMAGSSFDTNNSDDDNIKRVKRAFELLPEDCRPHEDEYVFKETIPRAAAISEPGQRLAYADKRRRAVNIKKRFDDLSDELVLKLRNHLPGGRI